MSGAMTSTPGPLGLNLSTMRSTLSMALQWSKLPQLLSAYRPFKVLFLLLLIVNVRSFPLIWHVRVFHVMATWHIRRLLFWNDKKFVKINTPIGKSPFELVHIIPGFASPDDCDVFGHLSNSSYAKTLDTARFQWCMKAFIPFFAEKGFMALAGSHYSFLKEIPALAPFEMRIAIGGYDQKWMYLIAYFISYPKGRSKKETVKDHASVPPFPLSSELLPSGSVLHSITVSRYCFKLKRLTVPPPVVFAMSGLGGTPEIGRERWDRKEALLKEGKLGALLKGGAWAEESVRPTDEGGWGLEECEEARQKGMEVCAMLASGMDGLKPVVR